MGRAAHWLDETVDALPYILGLSQIFHSMTVALAALAHSWLMLVF